jgi:hypothetical protein
MQILTKDSRVASTRDLLPSERRFLSAMGELGFGQIESIPIVAGELSLDPWPVAVRDVKLDGLESAAHHQPSSEHDLKRQVVEFYAYVRNVEAGEIRSLTVRHGLPFSMRLAYHPGHESS